MFRRLIINEKEKKMSFEFVNKCKKNLKVTERPHSSAKILLTCIIFDQNIFFDVGMGRVPETRVLEVPTKEYSG